MNNQNMNLNNQNMNFEIESKTLDGHLLKVFNIYNIYKWEDHSLIGTYRVISKSVNDDKIIELENLRYRDEDEDDLIINYSKIFGRYPVDLKGAYLRDADLSYANLEYFNLSNANLILANLKGANLEGANLEGADLSYATLFDVKSGKIKGIPKLEPYDYKLKNGYLIGPSVDLRLANLQDIDLNRTDLSFANLSFAKLQRAKLRGANLLGARLRGAKLQGANLDGALLNDNDISQLQLSQIIGEPIIIQRTMSQAQSVLFINKELSNGNKLSLSDSKKLDKNNNKTQYKISFSRLFDFLLNKKNQVHIAKKFKIRGEEGIDMGGITLIIFQKCYDVFMERYFTSYETDDNSNYVVLKDLNDEIFDEFKKACEFMILLAKKVINSLQECNPELDSESFKILIPINSLLFDVLMFQGNPETFFNITNKNNFFGKKENGSYSKNHKLTNPYINFIPNNNLNNNNNNKKFNNVSEEKQQKLMFLMLLTDNHILKRKQYNTMKKFIDEIYKPNKIFFTTYIDYNYDAFIKRLKFIISDSSGSLNFASFVSLPIASNPLIKLLLDYIRESDDYRKVMTAYICGSYCYNGNINIYIFESHSNIPFQSHTCSKQLDIFINPKNSKTYNWLKENNNYSIKGLYNVFLDKTTQIA